MRISKQLFLLGASALFTVTTAQGCDKGPFGSPRQVSGAPWDKAAGGEFCDTHWETGAVVTGVEVWSTKWQTKGLQLRYSDGTKGPLHGKGDGDYSHDVISWDQGQRVDKIQKWPNWNQGKGPDAVGGVRIEVDGRKLEVKSDVGSYGGESVMTHSGIILGAKGRQGDFLDTLEWIMMASDAGQAKIIDIQYQRSLDDVNKEMQGLEKKNVAEVFIKNSNTVGGNKTYTFKNGKQLSNSVTISHGTEHVFGFKLGFKVGGKVGVPLVAEGSVEASTEVSYQMTKKKSEDLKDEWTTSAEWWEQGILEPGRAVHCTSSSWNGVYEDDYVATVEVKLADGGVFLIKQPGHTKSSSWTKAVSECKNIPVDEAPDNAEEADDEDNLAVNLPAEGSPLEGTLPEVTLPAERRAVSFSA